MRDQSLLVAFVAAAAVLVVTHAATVQPTDTTKDNEINVDERFKPDPKIPKALDPRFNKMIMPKQPIDVLVDSTTAAAAVKTKKPPTTKVETSTIGIVPLKDDKLEEEMLKDVSHADVAKGEDDTDATYDDYYDEQDEFSDEDDDDIASDNSETKTAAKTDETKKEEDEIEDEYVDNDEDTDDDEEVDDMQDDINKVTDMKKCPRDCICESNMEHYYVATCSRLDLETQSFANLLITDLQVIDIGPQYPIVLGVEFFKKIGLVNVTSIKIANSSIEYISPSAFNGLNELYSVNLTNIGIDLIHPDTFSNNTKLKILTLSGNNLNVMQSLSSPYTDYMLKSPSIEELDISYCNMQEFLPTAFSQMKNIIYINLAGNKLTTLPQGLFDKADTIEELDLSHNKITNLPKDIFKKTPLAILHLKYNEISSNIEFITKDIQKLDMSFNKIKDVDSKMFKGMENLASLVLKGNQIRKIHPAAFVSLKGLLQIDLSYNDLDQINSMTFNRNVDLEIVRINNNMRLKTLPVDGFESMGKSFNVFSLDLSNCDIANLTENVFKTMPFIRKLNLSGNRIGLLPKNIFGPLALLRELDLSYNGISFMDPNIFWNNRDLSKLYLQSNAFESLSAQLFVPTINLEELDVSDGDLVSLWTDSSSKKRSGDLLKNLKVLNASNNDIKSIFESDIFTMKTLKVLDLKNNPLECNDDFRGTMKFLGTREVSLGNRNNYHETGTMHSSVDHEEMSLAIEWNDFARDVCKRYKENKKIDQEVLDKIDDDDYDDEEEEIDETADSDEETPMDVEKLPVKPKEQEKSTKKPIPSTKAPKEKTTAKPKSTPSVPPHPVDSGNENDESQADDDYTEDDYNEEDDDEEDREDEAIAETSSEKKNNLINGIKVITDVDSGIFGGSADDDDDDSDEIEEVLIKKATMNYRYLWPILIVMLSIVILLLVIMNVIAMCTRRRGELYRQALRQSSNSIIYQKLSEEISPQTPKVHRFVLVPEAINQQTPKAHRYTPIQQV